MLLFHLKNMEIANTFFEICAPVRRALLYNGNRTSSKTEEITGRKLIQLEEQNNE